MSMNLDRKGFNRVDERIRNSESTQRWPNSDTDYDDGRYNSEGTKSKEFTRAFTEATGIIISLREVDTLTPDQSKKLEKLHSKLQKLQSDSDEEKLVRHLSEIQIFQNSLTQTLDTPDQSGVVELDDSLKTPDYIENTTEAAELHSPESFFNALKLQLESVGATEETIATKVAKIKELHEKGRYSEGEMTQSRIDLIVHNFMFETETNEASDRNFTNNTLETVPAHSTEDLAEPLEVNERAADTLTSIDSLLETPDLDLMIKNDLVNLKVVITKTLGKLNTPDNYSHSETITKDKETYSKLLEKLINKVSYLEEELGTSFLEKITPDSYAATPEESESNQTGTEPTSIDPEVGATSAKFMSPAEYTDTISEILTVKDFSAEEIQHALTRDFGDIDEQKKYRVKPHTIGSKVQEIRDDILKRRLTLQESTGEPTGTAPDNLPTGESPHMDGGFDKKNNHQDSDEDEPENIDNVMIKRTEAREHFKDIKAQYETALAAHYQQSKGSDRNKPDTLTTLEAAYQLAKKARYTTLRTSMKQEGILDKGTQASEDGSTENFASQDERREARLNKAAASTLVIQAARTRMTMRSEALEQASKDSYFNKNTLPKIKKALDFMGKHKTKFKAASLTAAVGLAVAAAPGVALAAGAGAATSWWVRGMASAKGGALGYTAGRAATGLGRAMLEERFEKAKKTATANFNIDDLDQLEKTIVDRGNSNEWLKRNKSKIVAGSTIAGAFAGGGLAGGLSRESLEHGLSTDPLDPAAGLHEVNDGAAEELGQSPATNSTDELIQPESDSTAFNREAAALHPDQTPTVPEQTNQPHVDIDSTYHTAYNTGGEVAAVSPEETVSAEAELIPDSHTVVRGDNLWNITKASYAEQLEGLTLDQKNYVLDAVFDKVRTDSDLINDLGVRSGDIDLIRPDEVLNVGLLHEMIEAEVAKFDPEQLDAVPSSLAPETSPTPLARPDHLDTTPVTPVVEKSLAPETSPTPLERPATPAEIASVAADYKIPESMAKEALAQFDSPEAFQEAWHDAINKIGRSQSGVGFNFQEGRVPNQDLEEVFNKMKHVPLRGGNTSIGGHILSFDEVKEIAAPSEKTDFLRSLGMRSLDRYNPAAERWVEQFNKMTTATDGGLGIKVSPSMTYGELFTKYLLLTTKK